MRSTSHQQLLRNLLCEQNLRKAVSYSLLETHCVNSISGILGVNSLRGSHGHISGTLSASDEHNTVIALDEHITLTTCEEDSTSTDYEDHMVISREENSSL